MGNTSKVTHNGLRFLPRVFSVVAESSRLRQVCQRQEIWSTGRLENVKLMQMEDSERHKNAWRRCVRPSDYFVPRLLRKHLRSQRQWCYSRRLPGVNVAGKTGRRIYSGAESRGEWERLRPAINCIARYLVVWWLFELQLPTFITNGSCLQKSFQCNYTWTPWAEIYSHDFYLIFRSQCVLQCVKAADGGQKNVIFTQREPQTIHFFSFFMCQCALDFLLCFQQS